MGASLPSADGRWRLDRLRSREPAGGWRVRRRRDGGVPRACWRTCLLSRGSARTGGQRPCRGCRCWVGRGSVGAERGRGRMLIGWGCRLCRGRRACRRGCSRCRGEAFGRRGGRWRGCWFRGRRRRLWMLDLEMVVVVVVVFGGTHDREAFRGRLGGLCRWGR